MKDVQQFKKIILAEYMVYRFLLIFIFRRKLPTFNRYGSFRVYLVSEFNNLGVSLSGYKLTVPRVCTCSVVLLKEKDGHGRDKMEKRIETKVTDIRIFNNL